MLNWTLCSHPQTNFSDRTDFYVRTRIMVTIYAFQRQQLEFVQTQKQR